MKKQKLLFNKALTRYKKYQRKLSRLEVTGRNQHRQNVLKKHIDRLHVWLTNMVLSIKRNTVAGALLVVTCVAAHQSADAQSFDAVQENPFNLSNIGYSSPAFVDLDDDGDLDVMTGSSSGNFFYFENTGTTSAPSFATDVMNPFSLVDIGSYSKLNFADLDNDGDLDIVAGEGGSDFQYFQNTGSATSPNFAASVTNPFSLNTSGLGNELRPSFADLDDDGDLDLMTGDNTGALHYFENTGSLTSPTYASFTTSPFSIDIGVFDTYSVPTLVDLDYDGDYDLVVGDNAGNFTYFQNTGTKSAPIFAASSTNPFGSFENGSYANTAFSDLDGDGDLDMIAGDGNGNFYYFENTQIDNPVVWDGETSANWATATNWVGDVLPTSTDDVMIPDETNDPVITTAVEVKSINVQAGGALSINSNSLKVNEVTILNGTMTVASGASFVPLGNLSGGGSATVSKNTTFNTSVGRYSVIGSPIASGSTSSLGSIVYSYDETIAYDPGGTAGSARFQEVSTPQTMPVGDAYFSANTGNISFTGIPNSGDVDVSLDYDASRDGGASSAGFNLVANPYTAAISYDAFVAANPDIAATIYLWDDGGSNVMQRSNADYVTANSMGAASGGSTRSGSWDGFIRSTQGFFVKAESAGTLSFSPTMMDIGNNSDGGFFRKADNTVLRFSLNSENNYSDILIGFTGDATLGLDRALDAQKVKGNNPIQFYSRAEESILAIQALPIVEGEFIVDLGFDAVEAGSYTIKIEDMDSYDSDILLLDRLLNQFINLSKVGSHTFQTETALNSDRFSLFFAPVAVLASNDQLKSTDLVVFAKDNQLNIKLGYELNDATISIYSLSGAMIKQMRNVNLSEEPLTFDFDQSGLFVLTVDSGNDLMVKKFIK